MAAPHRGTCFCGAVEITATGEPLEMGYCHCADCRAHSGAPFIAYILWNAETVKVTRGGALGGAPVGPLDQGSSCCEGFVLRIFGLKGHCQPGDLATLHFRQIAMQPKGRQRSLCHLEGEFGLASFQLRHFIRRGGAWKARFDSGNQPLNVALRIWADSSAAV